MSIIKRNRRLVDQDVFSENAWDDIEWTDEMVIEAKRRIEEQKEESKTRDISASEVEDQAEEKWNIFYQSHQDKFFKDRKWILSEFTELMPYLMSGSDPCNLLEVGCGVGNAVAQFINDNQNENLYIYCCDISSKAIETLKGRDFYRSNSRMISAFQADISKDFDTKVLPLVKAGSLNFITLIFSLSALKPDSMAVTIKNLASLLKPNGLMFFRDYAQFDLTQLRFKGKSYISENYYVRSDGTTSYFFTEDHVRELFTNAGLNEVELKRDNRLLVNRQKCLKMCRCWIQAKFIKTPST